MPSSAQRTICVGDQICACQACTPALLNISPGPILCIVNTTYNNNNNKYSLFLITGKMLLFIFSAMFASTEKETLHINICKYILMSELYMIDRHGHFHS